MSRENVEAVRQPIAVHANSRRTLEERLGLRFPRAQVLYARAFWRFWRSLPARSRLRQALARRYTQRGYEALNRGDFEAAFTLCHPDIESIFAPQLVAVGGFDSVSRGRQARLEAQARWVAEWGEFRFEPEELIDLGDDRLLQVGRITGSGLSSGASVDTDWAVLVTVSAGLVIREQSFLDHDEALEAVGLRE